MKDVHGPKVKKQQLAVETYAKIFKFLNFPLTKFKIDPTFWMELDLQVFNFHQLSICVKNCGRCQRPLER